MQYQQTSRWPVIIIWLYFFLFPVSLLQSVVANPFLSNVIYALKGILVLSGFGYIFMFRRKVILPSLGVVGFMISILLNLVTVNKFVIDIWALYLLSFLVYNLDHVEQKKLVRYNGWTYLLTPLLLVAGTVSGFIRSDMWFTEEGLQFSFGLANPNYFMFFFLYACFCWMLYNNNVLLVISFVLSVLFYYITETRSVLYGCLYIVGIHFLFIVFKQWRLQLLARGVALMVVIVINLALFLIVTGYYYEFLESVAVADENLRSRVFFLLETIDFLRSNPDVLLFGGHEAKLDNMYLNLISALGIIHFAFLWLLLQYCLIKSIMNNQYNKFILISCMLLIGFIEHGLYSTVLPSVLIFVFMVQSKNIVFKGVNNDPALAVR